MRNLNISLKYSILMIPIYALGLTVLTLWIQPMSIAHVFLCIREGGGLAFVLNFLPVLLLCFTVYFIVGNLALSFSFTGIVLVALSFVNRYKILLRSDPLLPWDFSMGFEVMGIAKSFGVKFIALVVLGIVVCGAISVFAAYIIKNDMPGIKLRAAGLTICILTVVFCNNKLYKSGTINSSLYVLGNRYNQVSTFNSKGFLYSFIYTFNTSKISKPDDYDPSGVERKIEEFQASTELEQAPKPHILLILGEAFSEMSLNPAFDFTGYDDPLKNYKKIKEKGYSGRIIVPNRGGGTADTEFDILTGLSTRHLRGVPFSFRLVNKDFEALPGILKVIGYKAQALHPGYAWFYNRQNVFRYFGFEDNVFIEAFDPATQDKGLYINEEATFDKFIEMFETHLESSPGSPWFGYCITIQNHGPYNDKYDAETNFAALGIDLSDEDINAISNYFLGLTDADIQLGRLADYMDESSEPIVLVYYGDHLPAFTSRVYDTFYPDVYGEGTFESLTNLYSLPFLIYANDAAESIIPIGGNIERLTATECMSSNYLGAFTLEVLGLNGISPFFDHLNVLRKQFPVVWESHSYSADGRLSTDMEVNEKEDLITYRNWEFFKLFP